MQPVRKMGGSMEKLMSREARAFFLCSRYSRANVKHPRAIRAQNFAIHKLFSSIRVHWCTKSWVRAHCCTKLGCPRAPVHKITWHKKKVGEKGPAREPCFFSRFKSSSVRRFPAWGQSMRGYSTPKAPICFQTDSRVRFSTLNIK